MATKPKLPAPPDPTKVAQKPPALKVRENDAQHMVLTIPMAIARMSITDGAATIELTKNTAKSLAETILLKLGVPMAEGDDDEEDDVCEECGETVGDCECDNED